jgi:hypothetical protein
MDKEVAKKIKEEKRKGGEEKRARHHCNIECG